MDVEQLQVAMARAATQLIMAQFAAQYRVSDPGVMAEGVYARLKLMLERYATISARLTREASKERP
ncbi:MAG TPA: hypothetical protein VD866_17610 [Urbifossiella sp.]|nr:hypothetical protein [Urbifossiella sp.]